MRANQLSSQSGGTCQCSFDHFGALYAVNVQMAPTTVATDPVLCDGIPKLASVMSVPLQACYHNDKITL